MSARPHKIPNHDAIVRAVASSTAIETSQRIAVIEAKLRSGESRVAHLALALNRSALPARH
jgi:hypothetical protein